MHFASGYALTVGGDPVTTTYVYDGLGRLTGETTGEDSITYTYDASGNRIGMNQNGTVTAYAYDANNRLLSETVGDTVTTYTYDANGNTLTAGDKTYTYNDRGQQTGYSNGTATAAYAYNPSGLRKAKTVGGSTKYFVYNGMNIVYEYSESVADGIAYFYGLNRTHNSEGEIYVYNAHGDVVQLVKDNSVVASYTYDAFGNLTSQIGESDNPFLYCGEYFDAETQTYYLRARYYNPANGRFNAEDPVKDGFNWYAYCGNNPIMYVDPTGLIMEGDENLPDEIQILLNGINKDGKGGLSLAWTLASEERRKTIADFAKKLRSFDVTSINRVIPLINSSGAFGAGHTATMIINEQDQALLLSYYPSTMSIETAGQMRIGVYDAVEWNNALYSSNEVDLIGSNGIVESESYTGSLYLTVSSENGRNAFKTIANLYNDPGTYSLFSNNCDHQTSYIVSSAGLYYEKHPLPNDSFTYTRAYHTDRKTWYWYKIRDIVSSSQVISY